MVSGNILAIVQSNIKRMLAYSSIGQSGYMLMGIICASSLGSSGLILHMTGYAATSMLVFSSIIIIHNNVLSDQIQDYAGIAKRNPLAAICITASLFSLAGLPFFAGFTTKFYLFAATAKEDMLWLAGIAATASVISLYYYLRVIKEMYVSDPISSTKIYTTKTLSTFVCIYSFVHIKPLFVAIFNLFIPILLIFPVTPTAIRTLSAFIGSNPSMETVAIPFDFLILLMFASVITFIFLFLNIFVNSYTT